jgi:hypothetical protein
MFSTTPEVIMMIIPNGRKTSIVLLFHFLLLGFGWLPFCGIQAKSDDFYESIIKFDDVLRKVETQYVVAVPPESLITYAINGMSEILDPHTVYFSAEVNKNFEEKLAGEFGGLGIQIGIRADWPTVIAPMPIRRRKRPGFYRVTPLLKLTAVRQKASAWKRRSASCADPRGPR